MVLTSLSISGAQRQPSIDTSVISTIDTLAPPSCASISNQVQTTSSSDVFLQSYKLRSSGSDPSLFPSDLLRNLKNFYDDLRVIPNQGTSITLPQEIDEYLKKLETTQLPVLNLVDACVKDLSSPDFNKLQEQKEQTSESKLRMESIRNPERHVSYYESWFPLFRPMSEVALFGIFGVGLLFLLLSTGIFLRIAGVNFQILFPYSTGVSINSSYLYMGAGLGVVIGVIWAIWFNKS